MRTEQLSELERHARLMVDQLGHDKTALIIHEDGTPAAYLVEPETYQSALERLNLLEAVAAGERDIAQGNILTHDQVKAKMAKWLK